ncbi:capsule biosynthesis protein [Pseudoroseicyclus aestuarii]|nr:capsule biosynthesis protein CapA [Pseudoroseicyclus aestuarii]
MSQPASRQFLFLQGPHGPFFDRLGRALRAAGAGTWRVGFNGGDALFWHEPGSYIPYRGAPEDWPEKLRELIEAHGITDLVLYGDSRPLHAAAVEAAREQALRLHVFEEGYMRPWWITYERGGTNGNSRLMELGLSRMRAVLPPEAPQASEAADRWGEMRHHMVWGALYHWCVLALTHRYRLYRGHRAHPLREEARRHMLGMLLMPLQALERWLATRLLLRSGQPYHIVLLQLDHDSNLQDHSDLTGSEQLVEQTLDGFAEGAPPHHRLVFKAHPLEASAPALRRMIRRAARARDLGGRVHFIPGGKLARLLDQARSAVTVNSTAAQQVLWRGIPLRIFGRAVYDKPGLTSPQTLPAFFAAPRRPDAAAYALYRRYLLATSQVPGSYYSARGRRRLLRRITDMMLAEHDPYEALEAAQARPPLRLVASKQQPEGDMQTAGTRIEPYAQQ